MEKPFGKIDKSVFWISALISLFFVAWAVIFPDSAGPTFGVWLSFFTGNFGWLYLIILTVFVFFLVFLCVSKIGNIKLGKDDDKPEFKTSSWFFMLFSASMGIGLVFWSVAEPIYHFIDPPFGQGGTVEAANIAMRTTFVHWGLHPWAVYGVVGMALAYWQFRKDKPALISSTLIPVYGEKGAQSWMGKAVDILAVFATIFGVATSLGLGAMQVNSGLNYVYNVPVTNTITVAIIVVVTVAFIVSAVTGIEKGILFLSNLNVFIAALIMLFVLFFGGQTVFLLNVLTDSIGTYLQDFMKISLWSDPYSTKPGWLGGWTVFYWAWWLAWGPFVGGFVARISKGRTIREYVIGTLFAPVLASFIWLSIMSGSAINYELAGNTVISEAVNLNVANALFALLGQLPMAAVTSTIATILICTFFITSADSATFVCAMMTSHGVQNPHKNLKIFWGVIEGLVAAVLLAVGGLTALQTASIVAAFPFMLVCGVLVYAMYKAFSTDPTVTKDKQAGQAYSGTSEAGQKMSL